MAEAWLSFFQTVRGPLSIARIMPSLMWFQENEKLVIHVLSHLGAQMSPCMVTRCSGDTVRA